MHGLAGLYFEDEILLSLKKWVSRAIEVSKFGPPKQMSICIMYTYYIHILVHMLLRGFWPMVTLQVDAAVKL